MLLRILDYACLAKIPIRRGERVFQDCNV